MDVVAELHRYGSRLSRAVERVPRLAAAFAAGVVAGWLSLGLLDFPVRLQSAPGGLSPEWQLEYVRMVARDFDITSDRVAAERRLSGFSPTARATLVARLGDQAASLRRLVSPQPAAHTEALGATGGLASSAVRRGRWLVLATLGALVLAGVAAVGLAMASGRLRLPSLRQRPLRTLVGRREPTVPRATARPAEVSPWLPGTVKLGETVATSYDVRRGSYQSWLVYDEQSTLLGGAGLRARNIAGVKALDVWFFRRDEEPQELSTPTVTLLSRAAYDDPFVRGQVTDVAELQAAVPGHHLTLRSLDLVLEADVTFVEPPSDSDQTDLASVSLALRPRRREELAGGGLAEPPVPPPFRADDG